MPTKSKKSRKMPIWLIVVLCIVGFIATCYLTGLVIQLFSKLLSSLSEAIAAGASASLNIDFSFVGCIGYTISIPGAIIVAFVVLFAFLVIRYRRQLSRKKDVIKDERGFDVLKTGTYGTAGWMKERDMEYILKLVQHSDGTDTILGEADSGKLICMPDNLKGENRNEIIFGPPGTGKTRCIINNAIIAAIARGESIIVPDTKGELFRETAGLAERNGYTVRVFNLIDPDHSDCWNVFAGVEPGSMEATDIAQTIINNTEQGRVDPFWQNSELNLLKAVTLHVLGDSEPEEAKNLPYIYDVLLSGIENLTRYMGNLDPSQPEWAPWMIFTQNVKDTTQGSFIQGLGTRLQILQDPKIRRILTGNTEDCIDLSLPAQRKCAYYMIIDSQNANMEFLSSLFFTFLFGRLVRWADSNGGKCNVPVNIILDEFTNLGRLGVSQDGSDFIQTLSIIRSRYISATMAIQTLGQLEAKYGRELTSSLLGNCAYWIMLGCNDELTAKLWSDRSGDLTIDVISERTHRRNLVPFQIIPDYSASEGAGKRKLMNPDEVQRMKQVFGEKTLIISIEGHDMIRATKFDYTKNPLYHYLSPYEDVNTYNGSVTQSTNAHDKKYQTSDEMQESIENPEKDNKKISQKHAEKSMQQNEQNQRAEKTSKSNSGENHQGTKQTKQRSHSSQSQNTGKSNNSENIKKQESDEISEESKQTVNKRRRRKKTQTSQESSGSFETTEIDEKTNISDMWGN